MTTPGMAPLDQARVDALITHYRQFPARVLVDLQDRYSLEAEVVAALRYLMNSDEMRQSIAEAKAELDAYNRQCIRSGRHFLLAYLTCLSLLLFIWPGMSVWLLILMCLGMSRALYSDPLPERPVAHNEARSG